jgi:hypothetical protein
VSTIDVIKAVYKAIVEVNSNNSINSIPHSDELTKFIISSEGIAKEQILSIIEILKKSNMILSIEISKEDQDRGFESIDGYIDADLKTIQRLKTIFQYALVEIYKKERGVSAGAYQIIKEIFPRLNQLKGSRLGNIANKAIMLDEFEKLIEKKYNEYTDDFKKKLLEKHIKDHSIKIEIPEGKTALTKEKPAGKSDATRRAVDTEEYNDYTDAQKKYSLGKVLNIYGVNFFFRVHLRKYEFETVKNVILKGIISNKSDLLELKKMLEKLKKNFHRDEKLESFSGEIRDLERTVKRALHFKRR